MALIIRLLAIFEFIHRDVYQILCVPIIEHFFHLQHSMINLCEGKYKDATDHASANAVARN